MKIETINKKVTSFESVTKEKEVTVYIANDGKEFAMEGMCLAHERDLLAIENGKHLFKEIKLTDEQEIALLTLCFGSYSDISDRQIVGYKATSNPDETKKAIGYLYAKGFNNIKEPYLEKLNEGENYIITSWTEDGYSDHPRYDGKIIDLESVSSAINDLRNKIVEIKFDLE